ncbi:ATP-dependent DNA helicase DinG [Klebsiella pneumoniae]|uniref:ATP-dependent DNA helicase DinG n=1 Tax=Klebsiella pneumoniae TaxID=573 RepID=A0A377UZY8_KLEPN|nr:ATP-dependent DNA helicase DinG [Klebsiella pneumoniae]
MARREIQEAEVVVANHALVMAAMESEAVLPEPKNLLPGPRWKAIICRTSPATRWR